MSIGRGGSGWTCAQVAIMGGHVHWLPEREGMSSGSLASGGLHPWGAAGRGRRDLLGRHYKRERNDDVGVAGADSAGSVGASHELAEGIRQASLDPVPDHNAGAERGAGEELLGQGQRRAHQIIVRRGACMTSR